MNNHNVEPFGQCAVDSAAPAIIKPYLSRTQKIVATTVVALTSAVISPVVHQVLSWTKAMKYTQFLDGFIF